MQRSSQVTAVASLARPPSIDGTATLAPASTLAID
jgi:hypothetical protein